MSKRNVQIDDDRTKQVYKFILNYKAQNDGLSPTYKEIAKAMGMQTTSTVGHHIYKLVKAKKLKQKRGAFRGLIVTGATWTPPDSVGGV